MKKIFALNLLLMSAVAHAQELPYFAINNPDNNGTGNSAGLFSLNSTSTAFLHGSREWPTLSAKTNNGIVDSICQCNTPFNYLFRCFELQCLSRSVV